MFVIYIHIQYYFHMPQLSCLYHKLHSSLNCFLWWAKSKICFICFELSRIALKSTPEDWRRDGCVLQLRPESDQCPSCACLCSVPWHTWRTNSPESAFNPLWQYSSICQCCALCRSLTLKFTLRPPTWRVLSSTGAYSVSNRKVSFNSEITSVTSKLYLGVQLSKTLCPGLGCTSY